MSEITKAIEARQAQIHQLQSDIETLQRAANIVGRGAVTAKATSQPKAKRKRRVVAKTSPGQPKTAQKRKPMWSAAEKKAISRRMKAYWVKRRKAKT